MKKNVRITESDLGCKNWWLNCCILILLHWGKIFCVYSSSRASSQFFPQVQGQWSWMTIFSSITLTYVYLPWEGLFYSFSFSLWQILFFWKLSFNNLHWFERWKWISLKRWRSSLSGPRWWQNLFQLLGYGTINLRTLQWVLKVIIRQTLKRREEEFHPIIIDIFMWKKTEKPVDIIS